jgi:hypothetical protein
MALVQVTIIWEEREKHNIDCDVRTIVFLLTYDCDAVHNSIYAAGIEECYAADTNERSSSNNPSA